MPSFAAASSAAPLFEREAEMQRLGQVIESSVNGSGHTVVIEGPSGIGKSRLLAAATELAMASGADVLTTTGGELERDYPFGLVRRLLSKRVGKLSESESLALFRGHAGRVESLFRPTGADDAHTLADESQIVQGLYGLVFNLAQLRPVVLVADDLQWGDDLSLRFLLYLVQRLDDLPVALVCALRTGDPASESELVTRLSLQADTVLRPNELSRAAVARLLQTLKPEHDHPAEEVERYWSATRGNPFLLGEVAKSTTSAAGLELDPAPESIAKTVMLRLMTMGKNAVALARAVAVLGRSASLTSAATLSGLDYGHALAAASRLVAEQIFSPGEELTFHHPIIRSAVYLQYPPAERAAAHGRAAELLHEARAQPDEIAIHLMRAAPIDVPWARSALQLAAREAGRNGAPTTAITYLRRAIASGVPAPEERADLLFDLGIMEAAAGESTSLQHLEDALQLTEVSQIRSRAMYALGQTLFRYGRAAEARTVFRRGADLFADVDRETALAFEAGYTASATYLIDGLDEAYDRVSALAAGWSEPASRSAAERLLILHLAVFRAMSNPPSPDHAKLAIEALGDGVQLWQETSDGMTISHTALALTWCGFATEAVEVCTRVLDDAHERGDRLIFAEISLARALAMYALGRVDEAMADAESAIAGMRHGWNSTVPAPQGVLAYCLIDKGELDAAAEVIDEAAGHLRSGATETLNVWYYMARGRLHLARADPAKALEDFLHAGKLLEDRNFRNPNYLLVPWRSQAALAAHSLGQGQYAQQLVADDIELAESFVINNALGAALRVKALVSSSHVDIPALEQSLSALSAPNTSSLERARTLVELGAALRRKGSRKDSREPLREALDLAHISGAIDVESRARAELLASGARPRRTALTGAESLTPSEERIATLLADGLPTRAVADDLHLSISTIDWHRRNIYRKLDIRSRMELREALSND